ncbi:MAG: aspartate ammonia-lyase [Cenarchaeum symbiont of Oopsacas minuta]|nr:aspartate ammonia-lyase [Cenarchaeum symbiont of Oopsacas minuta]
MTMKYRIDEDSLGKINVPYDAYYGPFTARAIKQYHVTGHGPHPKLVDAFVMIKRSAAIANTKTKALDGKLSKMIVRACDRILDGEFREWFVVEMINSGAGTAFNMNTNEVVANIALTISKRKKGAYEYIHPNDHVNMSQSSNDTYPTAMHVSLSSNIKNVILASETLKKSLSKKATEFSSYKKIGRTHLMDALPVTLGSEFAAYAVAISKSNEMLKRVSTGLHMIALGGTAVGSGANTPKGYRNVVIAELAKISKIPLKPEPNMQHGLQSRFAITAVSSALKNMAIEITKIANDIRLMASGPVAGLAEIGIPAVHAGSSIMPGKVNPSLAECMNMICNNVIGNDTAVSLGSQGGQFELNVMLPGMLKCVLESSDMLSNFVPIFAANLIDGLTANPKRLQENIENSPVIVTLLTPRIGYQTSADIFKESLKTGKTVRSIALSRKLLTKTQIDALLG